MWPRLRSATMWSTARSIANERQDRRRSCTVSLAPNASLPLVGRRPSARTSLDVFHDVQWTGKRPRARACEATQFAKDGHRRGRQRNDERSRPLPSREQQVAAPFGRRIGG